jgi:hypothetical protein
MPQTPSQRARNNRAKGVRFEREIAARFRDAGFPCRRVLEFDGLAPGGWDIQLDSVPDVVIQCKNTKRAADLFNGLDEAIEHNGSERLFVSIHRSRRATRILASEGIKESGTYRTVSLDWVTLISVLNRALIQDSCLTRRPLLADYEVGAEAANVALSSHMFNQPTAPSSKSPTAAPRKAAEDTAFIAETPDTASLAGAL